MAPFLYDRLHAHAEDLSRRSHFLPLPAALGASLSLVRDTEALCAVAPRASVRRSLHRTAAVASIVAGKVAQWSGGDHGPHLAKAVDHAQAAEDGVMLARAHLCAARMEGNIHHEKDMPSSTVFDLLRRALWEMGASSSVAQLRATTLYLMAWEYAAQGDERGALVELDRADFELSRSKPNPDVRSEGASRRASVYRRLGRHADAEAHLADALSGPPIRTTAVLCDIARMRVEQHEVEMAATALEEAWLINWSSELSGRQDMVRSVRRLLPDCASVHQLDAVMRGSPRRRGLQLATGH